MNGMTPRAWPIWVIQIWYQPMIPRCVSFVYLLHSEKAREKVFHQLDRWNSLRKNPNLVIGVVCVASQRVKLLPNGNLCDMIFGPQTLHRLPEMLGKKSDGTVGRYWFPEIEKFDHLPTQRLMVLARLCRSWRVAQNTAPFVLCPTPEVKNDALS